MMTKFNFTYNSQRYWGWYDKESQEFKIEKEISQNETEVLGWAYYVTPQQCPEYCESDCGHCPYQVLDTAGLTWDEFEENFMKKIKRA